MSLPSASHYNRGDELIYEAEVIKVCCQVALALPKEIGTRFKIRVSSSEVIDAMLDEGRVKMVNRHRVIKILS